MYLLNWSLQIKDQMPCLSYKHARITILCFHRICQTIFIVTLAIYMKFWGMYKLLVSKYLCQRCPLSGGPKCQSPICRMFCYQIPFPHIFLLPLGWWWDREKVDDALRETDLVQFLIFLVWSLMTDITWLSITPSFCILGGLCGQAGALLYL